MDSDVMRRERKGRKSRERVVGRAEEEAAIKRWRNRWYILPGGSQGRGEGGSAIRQHIQEEVGKTLAVSTKIRRKKEETEQRLQEDEAGDILDFCFCQKFQKKHQINYLLFTYTYYLIITSL